MTIKAKIYAVIAIVAVFGAGYGVYHLLSNVPQNKGNVDVASITTFEACNKAGFPTIKHYPDQCQTPDGRIFVDGRKPDQSELAKAEQAIRTFMVEPNLELEYMSQNRHPANFSVYKPTGKTTANDDGGTYDFVEGWDRPVYIFQQKNYINDRCEVYEYEVSIETHQVIQVGVRYPEEIQPMMPDERISKCGQYGSLETPLKTKAEIEQIAFEYLRRDSENAKILVSPGIQSEYISSKKGSANPATNEWKWEDKSISLPEGLIGDPWQHPLIRIIISSGGKLIYYLNTTDLFKN